MRKNDPDMSMVSVRIRVWFGLGWVWVS